MTATNVRVQMQQRKDTAANWASANPTLLSGELGYETDTGKWKVGTGSAAWSSLAYTNWSQISYPIATADIADDAVTGAKLANNIDIAGTLDVTSAATFDDNVVVQGNLTVNGTTTTIDTTTLLIQDKNIELGVITPSEFSPPPSDFLADGGGITLKGTTDKTITWIDATDAWTFSEHLNIASGKEYRIAGTKVLDATSLGSAVVGSSLTSVGTIGTGVWNGTAIASAYIADSAITSAKITDGAIVDADINASAAIVDTKLGTISTAAKVSNSATTATDANTASAIVARDGSGNFAAGTVTAALTGNASTATALETARDIGGVSFDGTASISLPGVNAAGNQDTSGNAATSTVLSSARSFAVTGDVTGTVSSDLTSGASIATSIAAGAIVDADVNASAAIAGTKISPDFGSQAVTTTGLISADGKVSFPLGTAALPSLYPGSDTNTGIYSPGADQVAISTNGTERLQVDSSGNVKIASEHLRFNTSGKGIIFGIDGGSNRPSILGNYTSSTNNELIFSVTGTERMRIDSSGRLLHNTTATGTANIIIDSQLGNGSALRFIGKSANDGSEIDFYADNNSTRLGYLELNNTVTKLVSETSVPLSLHTNGNERLRIDSSGNVGIGTSSPAQDLHVLGTTGVRIQNSTDTDGLFLLTYSSNSPDFRMYDTAGAVTVKLLANGNSFFNGGNVGIGTTSPIRPLSVSNGGAEGFEFGPGDTAGTNLTLHYNRSTSAYIGSINQANYHTWSAGGASEKMRIDSSGRLLVGTSSALAIGGESAAKLQLVDASGTSAGWFNLARFSNSAGANAIQFGKSRGTTVGNYTIVQNGDTLGSITFAGADGTDLGSYGAQIQAQVDGTPGANDMPGRLVFSTTADGASSPTERMRINNSGNTSFKNATFTYPETDNAISFGGAGNRWTAVFAVNGSIQTSDEREKTQIANSQLGSNFIKSLRPVSYKWIEGGKRHNGEYDEAGNWIYESVPGQRTHWGFIAQEVKEAVDAAGVDFGGWVLTDKDDPDSQQALRYDQFIAPLTKTLQEALDEIDVLKAKVAALEGV